jgi:hypothetical protein
MYIVQPCSIVFDSLRQSKRKITSDPVLHVPVHGNELLSMYFRPLTLQTAQQESSLRHSPDIPVLPL